MCFGDYIKDKEFIKVLHTDFFSGCDIEYSIAVRHILSYRLLSNKVILLYLDYSLGGLKSTFRCYVEHLSFSS